ncbi:hypothetical protein RND81_13G035900 [Saponaria officinalis]|uniref:ARID domain-containing protein n=1 Tax=Saponaria officinalis TaxID=3572 RepID=A0AAW1GX46_SAPOF
MAKLSNFENGVLEKCSENSECDEFMDVGIENGDDNDDDDINWGDCDENLRRLFEQVLRVLMRGVYAKNGIRPTPALLGDGLAVDLFKLFCLVRDRGGFRSVSEDKLWGLIAEKLGFDYKLCASLKLIYFKYLDELDQWLNRITRDRVSTNGSYECGGNFGLLSLELEKRFRNFSMDGEESGEKDGERSFYEICNRINVVLEERLRLPEIGNGNEVYDDVNKCNVLDDDDKLCNNNDFARNASQCSSESSLKRKRDLFTEMLSWMLNVSKNPTRPSVVKSAGCSRWKGSDDRDFRSLVLSVREARLRRRYAYSNNEQSSLYQKNKMHPSMYEDDILHNSDEGLRSSKRLLSLVKTPPCHCCKSSSVNQCTLDRKSKSPSKNGPRIEEHVKTDSAGTKKVVVVPSVDNDPPIEKHVSLGPEFQADVPIWTGIVSESDPKWVGTPVWVPDFSKTRFQTELPGKGRPESCKCRFPGSVECNRFHIAESRFKLRKSLGLAFYHWKFDRMGEEVSLSWTIEDEKKFKHVVKLNTPQLGRSYFPKKKRTDLVSYYYNVYLINRRRYQNRVTPKEIDSDNDEAEFGSVGEAFGFNAVKVPRREPLICYQNEQVTDFD